MVVIPSTPDHRAPGMYRVRQHDRFFDRSGRPIVLSQWAEYRQDKDYCTLGYWEGEGGAWIYTFWLGLDMSFGTGALPTIFDCHVAAFGNQPQVDWTCPMDTEERAVAVHARVVEYVKRGVIPPYWELEDL